MEPEGSHMPGTGPYPEPDESSPNPFSLRPILVLFSHLRRDRPKWFFSSAFRTKSLLVFASSYECDKCDDNLRYPEDQIKADQRENLRSYIKNYSSRQLRKKHTRLPSIFYRL
jgi:hypothetical protein